MLYQEKVPGGKLVCMEIWPSQDGSAASKVKITGDFFLHPEDSITDIENSLVGLSLACSQNELTNKIQNSLNKNNAQLIGVTPEQLAEIFLKTTMQAEVSK
ncbi:hypothetical protein HY988_07360 [Candidatus Micrarchaeota archaeon]|nr:hypothetical protein [Candidatus Micrarchaeota archaeon]